MWYTHWVYNRPIESGLQNRKKLRNPFLGKYFPREKREVKVEKFINLREGNMSVEEYSFKFSLLSKYAPSFVSNPMDEMSRFVTNVSTL